MPAKKSIWQISKKRLFEDGLVFGLIIGFTANILADKWERYSESKRQAQNGTNQPK